MSSGRPSDGCADPSDFQPFEGTTSSSFQSWPDCDSKNMDCRSRSSSQGWLNRSLSSGRTTALEYLPGCGKPLALTRVTTFYPSQAKGQMPALPIAMLPGTMRFSSVVTILVRGILKCHQILDCHAFSQWSASLSVPNRQMVQGLGITCQAHLLKAFQICRIFQEASFLPSISQAGLLRPCKPAISRALPPIRPEIVLSNRFLSTKS